jgi:predicted ester cyclase
MTSPQLSDRAAGDHAQRAKQAIERVCARADVAAAPAYYSPRFVDHVNDFEYHGLEGVAESVALYRLVLPDLQMTVEEQLVDGERVVSRWRAHGTNRGRRVELWGITTSRFDDDGLIVEDWSASDNLGLVRRLGVWRTALVAIDYLRSRLRASGRR